MDWYQRMNERTLKNARIRIKMRVTKDIKYPTKKKVKIENFYYISNYNLIFLFKTNQKDHKVNSYHKMSWFHLDHFPTLVHIFHTHCSHTHSPSSSPSSLSLSYTGSKVHTRKLRISEKITWGIHYSSPNSPDFSSSSPSSKDSEPISERRISILPWWDSFDASISDRGIWPNPYSLPHCPCSYS